MANPPKAKGTAYETSLLKRYLTRVFPGIRRAEANNHSNDFTGPFPIEAKKRKTLAVPAWTRTLDDLSPGLWLLLCGPGDARAKGAHPELAVMPTEMAIRLLENFVLSYTDEHIDSHYWGAGWDGLNPAHDLDVPDDYMENLI